MKDKMFEDFARSRIKTVYRIWGRRCTVLTTWHVFVLESLGLMSVFGPRPDAVDLRLAVIVVSSKPEKLSRRLELGWWNRLWCLFTTWTDRREDVLAKWQGFLEQNRHFPRIHAPDEEGGRTMTQPWVFLRVAKMMAMMPGEKEDTFWNRALDDLAWSLHSVAEAKGQKVKFYTQEDLDLEAAVRQAPDPDEEAVRQYQEWQRRRMAGEETTTEQ